MSFTPATSKLEALLRISRGTRRPFQPLGPGSKEKKAVLEDVADALSLSVDLEQPKPELASSITRALGENWDKTCWSTGQTITLVGLNRVLQGAERHALWHHDIGAPSEPRVEAEAIVSTLEPAISHRWDGKACVLEMLEGGSRQWAQMEWAGFYFEFVGVTKCIKELGGGPATYGPTRFDYARDHVWDFKVHASGSDILILNDVGAIDEAAIVGKGVGFVVLSVAATRDEDHAFEEWHEHQKQLHRKAPDKPRATLRRHRYRKSAVSPSCLDVIHFPNSESITAALKAGVLDFFAQGRQPSGEPRRPKYQLSLRAADGSPYHLIHRDL